ncbi:MAG TPA: AGE family epimerase/isomerase, partial [Terracidiphilus sp.]|nr:AGE family epimerase/isomerase [Terracidiphilus sp.]
MPGYSTVNISNPDDSNSRRVSILGEHELGGDAALKSGFPALLPLLLCAALGASQQTPTPQSMITDAKPDAATYLKLAAEVDGALHDDVLNLWFPRSIDHEHGGFHSHFTRDWQWAPSDGKFSVFEGRMTWVASQVVLREPDKKAEFLPYVRQGLDFLENTMWDKQDGGFFWGLDDSGHITPAFGDGKQLYGIDFC